MAFEDLVARCLGGRERFVVLLIAGDVFDGEWKDATIGIAVLKTGKSARLSNLAFS